MTILYLMIPGCIALGLIMLACYVWAARAGQFEDLEGRKHQILFDD